MIEVSDLGKTFADGTRALDGVNVTIPDGDFVAVIGLSGAGKSTFLHCLNRLFDPTEGTILVGGTDVASLRGRALQRYRRTVGFIFQQFNLVTRLSVIENVISGRLGYHATWRGMLGLFSESNYQLAHSNIRNVGLAEKETTRVDSLSGGQQQRVAIARAMTQEPQLILADEPPWPASIHTSPTSSWGCSRATTKRTGSPCWSTSTSSSWPSATPEGCSPSTRDG